MVFAVAGQLLVADTDQDIPDFRPDAISLDPGPVRLESDEKAFGMAQGMIGHDAEPADPFRVGHYPGDIFQIIFPALLEYLLYFRRKNRPDLVEFHHVSRNASVHMLPSPNHTSTL